jgi:hypothetical protein
MIRDGAKCSSRWQVEGIGSADFGNNSLLIDEQVSVGFTNGSGANQASALAVKSYTGLASAGNQDIDLSGVLNDSLGGTFAPTKIKGFRIRHTGGTGSLSVGPAPANGWLGAFNATADRVKVIPGGYIDLVAPDANGYPVVAGTGDILRVTNNGADAASFKIELLGA